jgi:hypothetical protein
MEGTHSTKKLYIVMIMSNNTSLMRNQTQMLQGEDSQRMTHNNFLYHGSRIYRGRPGSGASFDILCCLNIANASCGSVFGRRKILDEGLFRRRTGKALVISIDPFQRALSFRREK